MNKKEFYEGIKKIESAYNTKFDREKLIDWFESLKDISAERYLARIDELKKTKQYIPNIAEIRNESARKQYANYEQREYTDIDFDSLYAN